MTEERTLRIREVAHKTGLSERTIYRLEQNKQFPPKVKIGVRAVAWRLSEIEAWMASRPAA